MNNDKEQNSQVSPPISRMREKRLQELRKKRMSHQSQHARPDISAIPAEENVTLVVAAEPVQDTGMIQRVKVARAAFLNIARLNLWFVRINRRFSGSG